MRQTVRKGSQKRKLQVRKSEEEKGTNQPEQVKKRKESVVYSGRQENQKRKWRKPSKGAYGGQETSVEGKLFSETSSSALHLL